MWGTVWMLVTHEAHNTFRGNQYKRNQNLKKDQLNNVTTVLKMQKELCEGLCGKCVWTSPGDAKANRTHVGQDVMDKVLFPAPRLEVDVDFGELQLNITEIVQK